MGLFGFGKKEKDKMKDGLEKTRTGFWGNILNTLTGSKIDDDLYDELEEQLILADVGGDTSHAAITSRELGIAAVIGIQNPTALQALDGLDVTVDGTRGRVYRGLLPLHEVGGEMDVEALPQTKTRVGLVLADIG